MRPNGSTDTRLARLRAALTPAEWGQVGAMAAVVLALHVVGFFVLIALVAPQQYALGAGAAFGVGLGVTAYTLGVRHAFDADHIAVVDNTTRKLMADGQRPLSTGFWFSLGHASVVVLLGVLVVVGVKGLGGAIASDGSWLQQTAGVVGPLVAGSFLLLIGIVNLCVLASVVGVVRRMRRGVFDEAELERQLDERGIMSRLYRRATRAVKRPLHLYPLGFLMGLGFDTATEVALLVLAGAGAAGGLPFYAIMCLPILFAAGMSLFDTIDGIAMRFAYGWAFAKPVRKVYYNLTVTGLSVAVALAIGSLSLLGVMIEQLGLRGGAWDAIAAIGLDHVGYAIVALFLLTWAGSVALWRWGRVEERWTRRLAASGPS